MQDKKSIIGYVYSEPDQYDTLIPAILVSNKEKIDAGGKEMNMSDMTKKLYPVTGMHCAACAGNVEKIVRKQEGVENASVNLAAATLAVTYNPDIVDYRPEHHAVFKRLNIIWINSHWSLEAHDLEVLDNPERAILSPGGHILVALVDNRPSGVVALCRMDSADYDFEIAKLAVDPEIRGVGIGEKILRAAIEKARELGAKKLFLESNTLLKPAIGLYRKLGFIELQDYHPAYARGDIQMELTL